MVSYHGCVLLAMDVLGYDSFLKKNELLVIQSKCHMTKKLWYASVSFYHSVLLGQIMTPWIFLHLLQKPKFLEFP